MDLSIGLYVYYVIKFYCILLLLVLHWTTLEEWKVINVKCALEAILTKLTVNSIALDVKHSHRFQIIRSTLFSRKITATTDLTDRLFHMKTLTCILNYCVVHF